MSVSLLTLLAFVMRLYRLAGPVLRWDEGWSVAHASLPWPLLWQVAAAEWHPPAYVALLKLWSVAGKSAWSVRYLSVALSTLAVPLAYRVARRWSGGRVAILAAGFAASWPLLVYYGQVARMYALSALAVLGAAWFILQSEDRPSLRADIGLVTCATVALYTLYHTASVLAGLWAYAAIWRPRRIPRLTALGLIALAAYVPWLLAARATIAQRLGGSAGDAGSALAVTLQLLRPALDGLAFVYGARPQAAMVLGLVLLAGLLVGPWCGAAAKKLLLPLIVVGASALGSAYSARTYWFAVRHLVPAAAFLGLLLAWALGRLARRWWPLLPAALLALGVVYWPTSTGYVYEKMLEVTDPFDPAEDYRYLAEHAGRGDLVYFNVLARAGWYENLRRPQDAAWSFAMRWDPVIEPMERIAARVLADSRTHQRLWFALYKGDFGPNGPLVAWLNANLYPAGGQWQGDMLYLAYVAPGGTWLEAAPMARFEQGIGLRSARWTTPGRGGDPCALELTWEAGTPIDLSYKVFVHVLDEAGRLVAQHDGIPGSGAQPTNAWRAGSQVLDRHGLLLPPPDAAGPRRYQVRVGFYDPDTGERLRLAGGDDSYELCLLEVP